MTDYPAADPAVVGNSNIDGFLCFQVWFLSPQSEVMIILVRTDETTQD